MKRLRFLHSLHRANCLARLYLVLLYLLACHLRQRISNIGILRGILTPNRRQRRAFYFINDRRQANFPYWLAVVHCLLTIIIWIALRPAASPWFLPFTWAASLSLTTLLWIHVNRSIRFVSQ